MRSKFFIPIWIVEIAVRVVPDLLLRLFGLTCASGGSRSEQSVCPIRRVPLYLRFAHCKHFQVGELYSHA
jgi:hypothetical protein